MITIHACSKRDLTILTQRINPKSKDEFDNDVSVVVQDSISRLGKFHLEFDTTDATDEQKEWVEEENS
jgi:hypothetical protein